MEPGTQVNRKRSRRVGALPKLCGADVELGNFVLDPARVGSTCHEASSALLREMPGVTSSSDSWSGWSQPDQDWGWHWGGGSYYTSARPCYDPQDWGRRFLPANGGCAYIDLNHLELCVPEVLSAFDHVAAWQAMLIIARDALHRANAKLGDGRRILAFANNSDGLGNSYGGHVNFLVSRRCWDNIFHRKLHHLLFLATYLTSSIIFTGAGKVGSENRRGPVDFQLSQRADFYETLTGLQTTYNRPIVNSRDESLCGKVAAGHDAGRTGSGLARLHVIFFDTTLCHVANLLKVGATQIVLAMVEQEYVPRLILDDPLRSLIAWSHDPSLGAKARLVSGRAHTALDVQQAILETASRFVAAGRADGLVPRAPEILKYWADTLELLRRRDMAALAPRLDWVLKRCMLERALSGRGLSWDSPAVKHLDQMYSSIDPADGIYWAYERSGAVQKVVTDGQVERFVHEPPEDTRAWLRAQLLRRAAPAEVSRMDWDVMRFKFPKQTRAWPSYKHLKLQLGNPFAGTRAECEERLSGAQSLQEALVLLGARETDSLGQPVAKADAPGRRALPPARAAEDGQGLFPVVELQDAGDVEFGSNGWQSTEGGKDDA